MDLLYANDKRGEYPASYWASVADTLPEFPPLTGETRADVCVIGAGYTGLSTALHLAEAGFDVVLLEAQRVGFGASGRNGGQVGTGQRLEQDELEAKAGLQTARALWDISEQSKSCLRGLIAKHNIDCDWRDGIIHAELRQRNLHHGHDYARKLSTEYSYDAIRPLDAEQICAELGSDAYCGGTLDMGAGHLNPLKYVLGLARAAQKAGVRIFESSKVVGHLDGKVAKTITTKGQVNSDFVVWAGNGYISKYQPAVESRVMPINNFIVATEPLGEAAAKALIKNDVAVADSKFVVNYFKRSPDHRLIFGGGESYGYRFPKDIAAKARKPMLEIYPQLKDARIDYAWGGTLAITVNRMPNFQRLGANVFSASGYSGHGVAMATLAGEIMAETIQGTAGRFDVMASMSPPRFPGGTLLRWPILVLAMTWFSLRDRL